MFSCLRIFSWVSNPIRHQFPGDQITGLFTATSANRRKFVLGLLLLIGSVPLSTPVQAQVTIKQLNEKTVGIGTSDPKAFLNVLMKRTVLFGVDSLGGKGRPTVVRIDKFGATFEGNFDPDYGTRTARNFRYLGQPIEPKMIWYGNKGAFRAGGVYTGTVKTSFDLVNSYPVPLPYSGANFAPNLALDRLTSYDTLSFQRFWDNAEYRNQIPGKNTTPARDIIGDFSFASGANTRASGQFSTAMGYQTQALGHFSTAVGFKSWAIGDLSIVLGNRSAAGDGAQLSTNTDQISAYDTPPFGNFAICIGSDSYAFAKNSLVLGNNSYTGGMYSVAIGFGSGVGSNVTEETPVGTKFTTESTFAPRSNSDKGQFSLAIGHKTRVTANEAMALGQESVASGTNANTLGYQTTASGALAIALGSQNQAKGQGSTALGNGTLADKQYSTAIGKDAKALNDFSVSLGFNSTASGAAAMALGIETEASGVQSTVLGYQTKASGKWSMALGTQAVALGESAISLGTSTTATGKYSTALGFNTKADRNYSTAMGSQTQALGQYTTATGFNTIASGDASIASGTGTQAIGPNSMAMGGSTQARGAAAVSMGTSTMASGQNAIAAGVSSRASGNQSFALGLGAIAGADGAISLGQNTTASGPNAVALGVNTIASGQSAFASGLSSIASGNSSFALGQSVQASGNNSVAIGSYVSTGGKTGSVILGDLFPIPFQTFEDNQIVMRFTGGYAFYTSPQAQGTGQPGTSVGVRLAPSGNAWITISDSTRKENFRAADGKAFLKKISQMRLGSWNYIGQDPKQYRHYGPMAQDFFAAFGRDSVGAVGESTGINQADFNGVNLIAIKALIREVDQLKADNQQLRAELESARQQEKNVQARLDKIETLLSDPAANRSVTFKP